VTVGVAVKVGVKVGVLVSVGVCVGVFVKPGVGVGVGHDGYPHSACASAQLPQGPLWKSKVLSQLYVILVGVAGTI